jgi:hypothetical protein
LLFGRWDNAADPSPNVAIRFLVNRDLSGYGACTAALGRLNFS